MKWTFARSDGRPLTAVFSKAQDKCMDNGGFIGITDRFFS